MHSARLEPTELILIGTRTTYQTTGDALFRENQLGKSPRGCVMLSEGRDTSRIRVLLYCCRNLFYNQSGRKYKDRLVIHINPPPALIFPSEL